MARVFSGIQPSGELHIGNYLGAVQNWVRLQTQHECLFCVVDLHAITQAYDTDTLAQRTIDMTIGLLASGLDPERCTLFVQSHVVEHSELNWLLNTVTPLGELERQTQFKDKAQRQESVLAGLLNYPVLQAADVLLYRATLVPVGVVTTVLSSVSGAERGTWALRVKVLSTRALPGSTVPSEPGSSPAASARIERCAVPA